MRSDQKHNLSVILLLIMVISFIAGGAYVMTIKSMELPIRIVVTVFCLLFAISFFDYFVKHIKTK